VSLEAARKLLVIIGNRKAEHHANVSPVTFQLCGLDGARASEGLPEKRISKFFDQCAKLGGLLWDHKGRRF
jgi:hypothetical protein